MTSLRNSSSTSAFLQELALNLRSRSASSCSASGVLQMNPTWCKSQQEVGEDGESMLLPDVLSKQGTQALSQQDRAVDSAFTWSSGLTPLIQATGELNPYDLRNAILPTWNPASKQQPLSPVATDVGLTGRFRDGEEGWFPSEERMSSLTQGVSSGIFSRSLDFEEETREASYDSGYKSPMNASRRFSFQDEKGTKQLLRGGVPQPSYGTSRTVAETTTVLSTVKGEAAVAGGLATQPAKLSSVPLKVQASAASIQSSNILTFHNNMSKISVPLTNTSLQQTTVTAERHNYTGSSQELEQQDGTTVKRIFERADGEVISEHKRCSSTVSDGEDGATSELIKRSKVADPAPTASTKFQSSSQTQVRKEKLGERITALQQLVSPFGKTDTASVLLEAIGYIKFLQEQVQVLSSPYMKPAMGRQDTGNISSSNSSDSPPDLRSRGLCLVPVSCTLNVANSNGADYWTSGISGGSRY